MRTATNHRQPDQGRPGPLLRAVLAVVLTTGLVMVGVSGPADASDISIPFDDLVFGQPGSIVDIATVQVDPGLVGRTCMLSVLAENQASVHKGNDLIVSTGTSQAVIFGVEDTPNGGTSETYEMVIGQTVSVQLRIGGDGMSSLGFDLSFDCVPPVSEQTTPTIDQQLVSTTTPVAPSVAPAVTSTTACVAGSTTTPGQVGASSVVGVADCSTTTTTCDATVIAGATGSTAGSAVVAGQDGCSTAPTTTCVPSTAATGAVTTVAGQAVTTTTTCVTGQVTGATTTTTTTTAPAPTPTVQGSSISRLPQTPAAPAVAGAPAYTG